tara:strand:- start:216 stop:608 length:393 start_codon:yes stop_codon:yes gene_type:complete
MKKEFKVGNIIRIPGNDDYEFWACIMIEKEITPHRSYEVSLLWYEGPDGITHTKEEWKEMHHPPLPVWAAPLDAYDPPTDTIGWGYYIDRATDSISLASEPPPKQSHQKQNRTHTRKRPAIRFKFAENPK